MNQFYFIGNIFFRHSQSSNNMSWETRNNITAKLNLD